MRRQCEANTIRLSGMMIAMLEIELDPDTNLRNAKEAAFFDLLQSKTRSLSKLNH